MWSFGFWVLKDTEGLKVTEPKHSADSMQLTEQIHIDSYVMAIIWGTFLKECLPITTETADYLILGKDMSGLAMYPTEISV